MPFAAIASFWAVSMLFVLTPGADWAYTISAGLRHRSIFPAIGGLLSGHLLATLTVAAGVAAILASIPIVLVVLTIAGSGYLVWLGVSMLRHPAPAQVDADSPDPPARSAWGQVVRGFGISGLNPKVFMLFLALLPQFVVASAAWPPTAQIVTLGLVHVANCAAVYIGVGLATRRVLGTRPAAGHWVSRVSGSVMIVLGVVLITEQILTHTHLLTP